jgi:hypothetical protein
LGLLPGAQKVIGWFLAFSRRIWETALPAWVETGPADTGPDALPLLRGLMLGGGVLFFNLNFWWTAILLIGTVLLRVSVG